jgi:hypothetical protein
MIAVVFKGATMTYQSILKFLFSMILLNNLFGCAQDSGNTGGGGDGGGQRPGANKPITQADCDRLWEEYLRNNPQGRTTEYENKSTTMVGEFRTSGLQSRMKTTITLNDGTRVVKLVETKNIAPVSNESSNEEIVTKETFALCKLPEGQPPEIPTDVNHRVLGRETIRVRAGSFATIHSQTTFRTTAEGMNAVTTTEAWTSVDMPELLIKSESETTNNMEGSTFKSITETELIFLQK